MRIKEFDDFIGFLANPDQDKAPLHWKSVIRYMIFGLVLAFLVAITIFIIYLLVSLLYSESLEYHGKDFANTTYGPIGVFILVNVLGPLVEELAYRLPLIRKRSFLFVSLSLLSYFFVCRFIGYSYYSIDSELPLRILGGLIFGILLTFLVQKKYFKINQSALVYISAIGFALMHITNYKLELTTFPLVIIKILPLIYLSFFTSFLRIRFGIASAILFHCLNNTIF